MNLVNELQISAENDDALTVIRKAKRLASKLGVSDIDLWLRSEQEGYGSEQVPTYRLINCSVSAQTNGYIPAGFGQGMNGYIELPQLGIIEQPFPDSIGDITCMLHEIDQNANFVGISLSDEISAVFRKRINPAFADQLSFMLKPNQIQLRAIPEAVKDRVLDWALALERKGVVGDNMTFNDSERQAARTIQFNIKDCRIEQLNNMGNNLRRTDV